MPSNKYSENIDKNTYKPLVDKEKENNGKVNTNKPLLVN